MHRRDDFADLLHQPGNVSGSASVERNREILREDRFPNLVNGYAFSQRRLHNSVRSQKRLKLLSTCLNLLYTVIVDR